MRNAEEKKAMTQMVHGKVFVFGDNVDTDQIYPGKYVEYTEIEDIRKYAMSGSAMPDLVKRFHPGDIIVAGRNFGCGSSREHAVMTLKGIGVGAILAESFGRIFFRNAINLGLPVITCKDIGTFFQNGDTAAVDLLAGTITNETAGTSVQAEPLSDYIMDILQHGGIKPLIRARLGVCQEFCVNRFNKQHRIAA